MRTLILSETSSDRITNYQSMNGIEVKCNNFFLFLNGWADHFDLYRKLNVKIWRMIWHIPIFGEFFRLTTMRESGPCLIFLTSVEKLYTFPLNCSFQSLANYLHNWNYSRAFELKSFNLVKVIFSLVRLRDGILLIF